MADEKRTREEWMARRRRDDNRKAVTTWEPARTLFRRCHGKREAVTSPVIGIVAFALSLLKLGVEFVKLFGNPDRWIPGHKAKKDRERQLQHYAWHCDSNPEGFERLKRENVDRKEHSRST